MQALLQDSAQWIFSLPQSQELVSFPKQLTVPILFKYLKRKRRVGTGPMDPFTWSLCNADKGNIWRILNLCGFEKNGTCQKRKLFLEAFVLTSYFCLKRTIFFFFVYSSDQSHTVSYWAINRKIKAWGMKELVQADSWSRTLKDQALAWERHRKMSKQMTSRLCSSTPSPVWNVRQCCVVERQAHKPASQHGSGCVNVTQLFNFSRARFLHL